MKTMQKYFLMTGIGMKHCERPYACQCRKALLSVPYGQIRSCRQGSELLVSDYFAWD